MPRKYKQPPKAKHATVVVAVMGVSAFPPKVILKPSLYLDGKLAQELPHQSISQHDKLYIEIPSEMFVIHMKEMKPWI